MCAALFLWPRRLNEQWHRLQQAMVVVDRQLQQEMKDKPRSKVGLDHLRSVDCLDPLLSSIRSLEMTLLL